MATTSIADARALAHFELTAKLNQLEALLLMTLDGGREAFAGLPAGTQSDYLTACTDLVQACRDLAKPIAPGGHENDSTKAGSGGAVAPSPATEAAADALEVYRHVASGLCHLRELAALLGEQAAENSITRTEALGAGMYDLAERVEQTLEGYSQSSDDQLRQRLTLAITDLCHIRSLASLVGDLAEGGDPDRIDALAGAIHDLAVRVDKTWDPAVEAS